MSGDREPTFAAARLDLEKALRRLNEIERRLGSLRVQFEANEREYQEIKTAGSILLAEHASLRSRINSQGHGA
jgi:hypothetical protein